MADVPVPGPELTPARVPDPAAIDLGGAIPGFVLDALRVLWSHGHAAYVVGGSLRDTLMGRPATDWDLATSARPETTLELFAGRAVYENQFGTVAVRPAADEAPADTGAGVDDLRSGAGDAPSSAGGADAQSRDLEITTFRSDHDYADFRRPHHVEFGDSILLDLARRDFTINAIAWGADGASDGALDDARAAPGSGDPAPRLVDPHGGRADLAARILRAVGDPSTRFEEDALRMVRAVRLAATLDVAIEPATYRAIASSAPLVAHLSGERIAAELRKLLDAGRPSVGLRLMGATGILAAISSDLAGQRGVPQNKVEGEDLWDHTLRAVDAARDASPLVRLAALLHDIGKPSTFADGRFLRHETVGAALAGTLLDELRWPRAERDRIVHLIRLHMFGYEPSWSDAAVRRFIAKVRPDAVEDLFALRAADNVGSGLPASAGRLDELRARVAAEFAADVVLDLHGLAIDGNDLMRELGLPPGPRIGRILRSLLHKVIADPAVNQPATLLKIARSMPRDDVARRDLGRGPT